MVKHIQDDTRPGASSADVSGWQNPLAYSGTINTVLVNSFGERDFDKLRRLEYAATYRRMQEL